MPYLFLKQPDILLGNMISDYIGIKGKTVRLPAARSAGQWPPVARMIDNFTDTHEGYLELKSFFRPAYSCMLGAFADIVYDHFLAIDTGNLNLPKPCTGLPSSKHTGSRKSGPPCFRPLAKCFLTRNTTLAVESMDILGAIESFNGFVRRSAYLNGKQHRLWYLHPPLWNMQQCYAAFFFPEVKKSTEYQLAMFKCGISILNKKMRDFSGFTVCFT